VRVTWACCGQLAAESRDQVVTNAAINQTSAVRCNCCMVPFAATAVSRRELLAGGAAALAIGTAAGFAPTVFAQAAPHRIDVHHHVSPPTWLDAVKSMKKDNPPMVSWSVQNNRRRPSRHSRRSSERGPHSRQSAQIPLSPQFRKLETVRAASIALARRAAHTPKFNRSAALALPRPPLKGRPWASAARMRVQVQVSLAPLPETPLCKAI
jgi:hypothetical protein